ncbi:hypothetical protein [Bacillus salacetis]|nr:hypothetical protein [Bacillus salacetis]
MKFIKQVLFIEGLFFCGEQPMRLGCVMEAADATNQPKVDRKRKFDDRKDKLVDRTPKLVDRTPKLVDRPYKLVDRTTKVDDKNLRSPQKPS